MSEQENSNLELSQKEQRLIEQLYQSLGKSSFYTLLGVPEDADTKQVRNAYYELSRHWHPDRFFRKNIGEYTHQVEAIFAAITEAYQTLSNSSRRANYDREQKKKRAAQPPPVQTESPPVEEVEPTNAVAAEAEAPAAEPQPEAPSSRSRARRRTTDPVRSRYRQRVLSQVRKGMADNIRRAKLHHTAGKKDLEEGNPVKAESALYLAVKLNPRNATYRKDFEDARRQARQIRAKQFVAAAESAEQYQNAQEAIYNYRKAVEYETDDARVFFRLGLLIKRIEKDERESLKALRMATIKDPENADYRIALAEMYAEQGLALNARREYQEAVKLATDKETRTRARDGIRLLR